MANISTELQAILNAVYGEEVRGSIHDAIDLINKVGEKVLIIGTSSPSIEAYENSLYLNKTNWYLYQYISGSWTFLVNLKGSDGKGIESITKTRTVGLVDTYTITFDDETTTTFNVTNGARGEDGKGIESITKTGTVGLVDTYTITFDDGTTTTFNVTNGARGEDGNGITSIELTSGSHTPGTLDTYTITYTNGTTDTIQVYNGADGTGAGDMTKNVYDSDNDVATAGGIKEFVNTHGAGKRVSSTVSGSTVAFTDTLISSSSSVIDGPYIQDILTGIQSQTISGNTLTFTLTDSAADTKNAYIYIRTV